MFKNTYFLKLIFSLLYYFIFIYGVKAISLKTEKPLKIYCTGPDTAGTINGKSVVCIGAAEVYSVATIANATGYNWTLPSGASIVSGANSNTIKVVFKGAGGNITVEGTNTCSTGVSSSFFVKVNPLPKLTLTSNQKYCCDYGSIALGSSAFASPTGGTWNCRQNSSYINSNTFLTSLACNPAKPEMYSLYYTYQDPTTACINKDSTKFTINPLPALKFDGGIICQDVNKVKLKTYIKAPVNLNSMASVQFRLLKTLPKVGGGFCTTNDLIKDEDASLNIDFWLWVSKSLIELGTKVKDSLIIEITIQDATGCFNKDTASFMIVNIPDITFDGFPELCIDAGKVDLKKISNVKPNAGCWSAIDLSGFNPKNSLTPGMLGCDSLNTFKLSIQNGPGLYRMRYIYTSSGCSVLLDTNLRINPLPRVSVGLSPQGDKGKYCENDPDVTLNSSPSGGVWTSSVAGVIGGNKFKPSAVQASDRDNWITLTYVYVNPITKCDTAKSLMVFVQSKPKVEIITSDIDTCANTIMNFKLEANYSNTSKINWIHNQNPTQANFDNTQQVSNINPTIFNFYPRNDIKAHVTITAYTETEGVCPFSMDTMKITTLPKPQVKIDFYTTESCVPCSVNFKSIIMNADSTKASFLWTFGEPNDVITQNATHTYITSGTFNANLKVTNDYGCNTIIGPLPINVYPLPKADFIASPDNKAMVSLPRFKFTDKSKTSELLLGSKIESYIWNFGATVDTDTSTKQNPEYFYPSDTGTYFVTLIIETNHHCRDTVTKPIIVIPDSPFQFVIYPNPNKGKFTIEINKQGFYSFRLYSIVGKLILEKTVEGYNLEVINQRLSKGNYIVSIQDSDGNLVNQKMIVE